MNHLVTLLLIGTFANQTRVLPSENHPNLRNISSPRTKACMKPTRQKNSVTWISGEFESSLSSNGTAISPGKVKTKRLTFTNVTEYIRGNTIRSYTSLKAITLTRRQKGEKNLFIIRTRNTSKSAQ